MEIELRLYEELNDFLSPELRKRRFRRALEEDADVRGLLALLGLPEREVELVLVNGESVDFAHRLEDGDSVALYPVFESFDVTPLVRERARSLRSIRFLLDAGLSDLSGRLRESGYDVLDASSMTPAEIVQVADSERRLLLTRDPEFASHPGLSRAYVVREAQSERQLAEVLKRLGMGPNSF